MLNDRPKSTLLLNPGRIVRSRINPHKREVAYGSRCPFGTLTGSPRRNARNTANLILRSKVASPQGSGAPNPN